MMQTKKGLKKFIRFFNRILLVAVVAILFACYFGTNDKEENPDPTIQIYPYQTALLDDGSKEYYFDLTEYDSHYSGLMFYTTHQAVEVYNAGRKVYSFTRTGGFWGSTTGSGYHMISINEKMLNVAVIITPMYDEVKDQEPNFYIGPSYQMSNELVEKSLPKFCASLFIIIFSFLIFAYYAFMRKKLMLSKDLIHLAHFSMFVGFWTINEADLTAILVDNKIFTSIIPYLCLMLLVPPFVLFFDGYLGINGKIIKRIVIYGSMVQFVIINILHFTKIAEYRQTLPYIQATIVIAAIYVIGSVIFQMIRRDYSRQTKICAIGLSLYIGSILMDVKTFYKAEGDSDTLGRYMFLIFISLLAADLITGTNEIIEKGRHAKQLEMFALTDSMTRLYNRNAFESHVKSVENIDNMIAVVADANGLKACNDTFGHDAGDQYIKIVADVFNGVFSRYGNCYRTGGDEFCCLITENKGADMERLMKVFATQIDAINAEGNHEYNIGVAIGYACYDPRLDLNLKALIKRADSSMYENKKECECNPRHEN